MCFPNTHLFICSFHEFCYFVESHDYNCFSPSSAYNVSLSVFSSAKLVVMNCYIGMFSFLHYCEKII